MAMELIKSTDPRLIELDFKLDGFRRQKVFKDVSAYAQMYKRLLLMKKGSNPSYPNMGIDLASYRFMDIDQLVGGTLRDEIRSQGMEYMPGLPLDDIAISKAKIQQDYVLFINIRLYAEQVVLEYAFVQRNRNIISTNLEIRSEKKIGVPR